MKIVQFTPVQAELIMNLLVREYWHEFAGIPATNDKKVLVEAAGALHEMLLAWPGIGRAPAYQRFQGISLAMDKAIANWDALHTVEAMLVGKSILYCDCGQALDENGCCHNKACPECVLDDDELPSDMHDAWKNNKG